MQNRSILLGCIAALGAGLLLGGIGWCQDREPPPDRPAFPPRGNLDDDFGGPPPPSHGRPEGPFGQKPSLGAPPTDPHRPPPHPPGMQPGGPQGGPHDLPRHKPPTGAGPFDPEMSKLDQSEVEWALKSEQLAIRYRHASPEEREQLKKELSEAVASHFEVRQKRRELQLEHLEKELQRLRESIEARNKHREQIVDKRISELLGEKDDLSF